MCGWDSGNGRKSKPTFMRPQRAQQEWDAVDDLLQESFTMFFHLHGHRSVQRKSRFQYFQCHFFYSSIMNLHSLSNVSLLEPALAARWKQRINFVNVRSLSEGFSGASCSCFPLVRGTATSRQAVRKMRKLLLFYLKTCLCSKQCFCHEHTCLQGTSFRDSAVKGGHKGRHRRTAKSPGCFFEWLP